MASRVCWYCNAYAHLRLLGQAFRTPKHLVVAGLFSCANCGHISLGLAEEPELFGSEWPEDPSHWLPDAPAIVWFPTRDEARSFPDVPPKIEDAASEAYRCHSIGAYRAAVLLARSVIEATAKDKEIDRGSLESKIDVMEEHDLIRPIIKNAANEIRHLGNEMAHGDFVEPVTEEESSETLELMGMVLN